jgi:hypothetical protein
VISSWLGGGLEDLTMAVNKEGKEEGKLRGIEDE